jgi:hypothetical protein
MRLFESTLDIFIYFIIAIKIIFGLSAVGHIILTHIPNETLEKKYDDKLVYWKERTEFVFVASMAILLIYHFKPGKNKPIGNETSILFFLFGWITLITAKWGLFFSEAPWYKKLVSSLK